MEEISLRNFGFFIKDELKIFVFTLNLPDKMKSRNCSDFISFVSLAFRQISGKRGMKEILFCNLKFFATPRINRLCLQVKLEA